MTKRENFEVLKAMVAETAMENQADLLAFIDHEIELLDSRKSKSSARKSADHSEIQGQITEAIAAIGRPAQVGEIVREIETATGIHYESQRVSGQLTLMKKVGTVVRTEEKKKAFFSLPDAE